MNKARIQPFCSANINNWGYYEGERVFLRSVTNRKKTLCLYNNLFHSILKSAGVSFNHTIQ